MIANAPAADRAGLTLHRAVTDADTVKLGLRTADGLEIESVLIPMGVRIEGRDKTWRTLCVSSQVGCGRGCTFCRTARMGLIRNLSAHEITGQISAARSFLASQTPSDCHADSPGGGPSIRNVVFMGMGEPLDNLDNVIAAIRMMHDDRRHQIPRRRIAVSTVGRCAGIRRLAALRWRRLSLAVSLNAPNDEIRSRIMPINRTEPMSALREAIAEYPVRAGGHVLIQYVLIRDLNDRPDHARQLLDFLRDLRTCVNVIPCNPIADASFQPPSESDIETFISILMDAGQLVFRRRTKGLAELAACGQLATTPSSHADVRPLAKHEETRTPRR